MTKIASHARIPFFPSARSLQGARLDNWREEIKGRRRDVVLEYREFSATISSEIIMRAGKLFDKLEGMTIAHRLRFLGVEDLIISGAYEKLGETPLNHPAREIRDMLCWVPGGQKLKVCLLINSSTEHDGFRLYARQVVQEGSNATSESFSLERDWSAPPPMRPGLIPESKKLYERFGGDPVTVRLNGRPCHRRLFIGSLVVQPDQRPDIGCVLNLGEESSQWVKEGNLPDSDRWVNKGEGPHGMSLEEIRSEAQWVIERLEAGERVLIHCVAGLNRSATICCAVLILLEGLSAEAALERVREHHLWARPDSNHWLKLRWLAEKK
jgi:hypothetical protein